MIKALEPGYDPPSRRVLSGTLLEAELFRVNARVNNELEKESNFTIALDEGSNVTLADCYLHLLRIAAFFKSMPTDDYKELRNSCISIFNKQYKEFDEDIYLLGFFLHPKYREHGIRDNQFERLRKCALRIWKNHRHKKILD
ncbi:unnamed protein product [Rhizophagus irregularis]|nr:unnamed protein product [Rhizophagus irregularis]